MPESESAFESASEGAVGDASEGASEGASNSSSDRALALYVDKRDFSATPEPRPKSRTAARRASAPIFVVQKHAARSLHFDFRLEAGGVLWSWAVPKGPSPDPAVKRMAVRTEDHPLAYADFEGCIPAGHYGAGVVEIWDSGTWRLVGSGDPALALRDGKLAFELHGKQLQGTWELVRTQPREGARAGVENWLLFKKKEPALVALQPQLAVLAQTGDAALAALDKKAWLLETKFDGYRVLGHLHAGRARLFTRNGHDWSAKLPALAAALEALPAGTAWFDGEVVARGANGLADFNRLQNAFEGVAAGGTATALEYWLFDLPHFDGHDLRNTALEQRRGLLKKLLAHGPRGGPLHFSAETPGPAVAALKRVCSAGGEGLIAKKRDAPYSSGRSDAWLKLKCRRRQEFVVGGFTLRQGSTVEIGSLLLGVFDAHGALQHAGSVGTGWNLAQARALRQRLVPLQRRTSPFAAPSETPASATRARRPRRTEGQEEWLRPQAVAEVSFAEWTPAGHVRHASFIALRLDKPAAQIRREEPMAASKATHTTPAVPVASPAPSARRKSARPAAVAVATTVTHGDRVIDTTSGTTKAELVAYFDAVADWLLPQLKGRPVALLRAPQGVSGAQFFQKHLQNPLLPGVQELDAALWPGHAPLLQIDSREGLLGAAQMNVIELHTGNSRSASISTPERIVFDLDPGDGVAFTAVKEAAVLVRALLAELGLKSWLKTSGGKGLHVVVPIRPMLAHDAVKAFSKQVVQHLARTVPARFVARSGPANRVGRIFVDYLRNGFAATTVAAFSPRARPGLGVSMTIDWEQLPELVSSAQWTLANAAHHLATRRADPWAALQRSRQSLPKAVARLNAALG